MTGSAALGEDFFSVIGGSPQVEGGKESLHHLFAGTGQSSRDYFRGRRSNRFAWMIAQKRDLRGRERCALHLAGGEGIEQSLTSVVPLKENRQEFALHAGCRVGKSNDQ